MQKGGYQIIDLSNYNAKPSLVAGTSYIKPDFDVYNVVKNTIKPILMYLPENIRIYLGQDAGEVTFPTANKGIFLTFFEQPDLYLVSVVVTWTAEAITTVKIRIAPDNEIYFIL